MLTITPLTVTDREDWIRLWNGYLTFYETTLSTETSAMTFNRLVDPDVRGGGVGRALISHVQEWATEHGSAKVYWLTAESNTTARALYDRVATRSGMIHYQIPLS